MSRNSARVAIGDLSRRLKTALEDQAMAERSLQMLTARNLVLEAEKEGFCRVISRQNREIWTLRRQIKGKNDERV